MLDAFTIQSRGCRMVTLIDYASPASRGKKVIVYKHGFMGHKITPHRMLVNLAHQLVHKGYSIVRFDCAGAGDSEGDCQMTTIDGELEDMCTVLRHVRSELRPEKLIVLGYSMGGCISTLATAHEPIDGLLLWAPVARVLSTFKNILGEERFAHGLAGQDVDFAGDRVGKKFFVGLDSPHHDPLPVIAAFEKPVRIIHGSGDTFVPLDDGLSYASTAKNSKIHIVPDADHNFDSVPQQDELFAHSMLYLDELMALA